LIRILFATGEITIRQQISRTKTIGPLVQAADYFRGESVAFCVSCPAALLTLLINSINNFYIVEKQISTLGKVHDNLRKTLDFQGCISTLKKIILKLGLRWKKTKNNRHVEIISIRILSVLPLCNRPV
jgi:hypothetical protein